MDKKRFEQVFEGELGGMSAKIAQDPLELWPVVERLNVLQPTRTLEIGVQYGGTTRFWQLLTTGQVVAIDLDTSQLTVDFSGHPLPLFIQGDSTARETIEKAQEYAPYDFLWIDGGHTNEMAKADWDNYSPMVRPGGLVGIHDVKAKREGPYKLFMEIKRAGFVHESFIEHKGTALIHIPTGAARNTIRPFVPYDGFDWLADFVKPHMRIFEYGSGKSTLWFGMTAGEVVAVEKWPHCYKTCAAELADLDITNVEYVLKPDIGGQEKNAGYSKSIHEYEGQFDLVFVDGHYRRECIEECYDKAKYAIFMDNTDSPGYQDAYSVMKSWTGGTLIDFYSYGLNPYTGEDLMDPQTFTVPVKWGAAVFLKDAYKDRDA